jgi:hypothetical protein
VLPGADRRINIVKVIKALCSTAAAVAKFAAGLIDETEARRRISDARQSIGRDRIDKS